MAAGLIDANTNIIMQSASYLLTRQRIRELVAAEQRADLLAVLAACNYQTNFADDDDLLNAEHAHTLATFVDACCEPALTTCVQALDGLNETNVDTTFATLAATVPHLKNASVREYFTTLADLTNVQTFYKGGQHFVPGGTLTPSQLDIFPGLTAAERAQACQQKLDAIAAADKDDIFQIKPLFWWYLQKQKEMMIVNIILTCKRFHFDATVIRENIRGLYEQF